MTDDGLPPLAAAGLKLHDRLSRIAASLDHVASLAGGLPGGLSRLRQLLRRGLEETAALWPAVREAYKWVKRVARILKDEARSRRFFVLLEALPIVLDGEAGNRAFADIVQLARNYQLSAYDAAYLELAIRRGLPLACLDDKLKTAAAAAGVVLFSPP